MPEVTEPEEEQLEEANESKEAAKKKAVKSPSEAAGTATGWLWLKRGRSVGCYWDASWDLFTPAGSPGQGCLMLRESKTKQNKTRTTQRVFHVLSLFISNM